MKINKNSIIIKNVNILAMNNNEISENKTIIIKNNSIEKIDNAIKDFDSIEMIIDAKGKYLMPGLINMHTHIGDNKNDMKLYLVNGVTTIRNMWGYEGFRFRHWLFGTRVFNHLAMKRQISEGTLLGPRIFTAGPLLDGETPFFSKFMYLHALNSREQINQIIKGQVEKGYDFIKIYSQLSKKNFEDIITVAKDYDIPVAGHVPDAVGIKQVIESKVQSIEHLYGFVNPYHPDQNMKKEDVKILANLAANNNVWNCPTLIANERLADINRQTEFEKEEQMNYISNRNKKAMRFLQKASNNLVTKKQIKGNHEYMNFYYYIIRQLREEGAGILLGTDKAVPYVVAGFSEHLEMKLLSEAGMSNYEILKAATINGAKCLKVDKDLGTVEVGKKADLILTNKNPLDDLDTIKKHEGIIKDGVYYSREMCDEILSNLHK